MKNRVRIVAPAGKHKEDSEIILQKGIELLEEQGFEVSVQDDIFGEVYPPVVANTKEVRLKGLRDAILDENIDIIWAFRGGVGCGELADHLMDIKPVGNKILVGFSDITYLHFLFNQHYKIPSIHGTVITSMVERYPSEAANIASILKGDEHQIQLKPVNNSPNNISGELLGGNFTIVTTLIGTKNHPDLKDKILLLEEVNERGWRVFRLFNHLEKAGLLEGLKAIIVGDFTNSDEYAEDVIEAFAKSHPNLPVYRAEGVGHGIDKNQAILLGKEVMIKDNILRFGLAK